MLAVVLAVVRDMVRAVVRRLLLGLGRGANQPRMRRRLAAARGAVADHAKCDVLLVDPCVPALRHRLCTRALAVLFDFFCRRVMMVVVVMVVVMVVVAPRCMAAVAAAVVLLVVRISPRAAGRR